MSNSWVLMEMVSGELDPGADLFLMVSVTRLVVSLVGGFRTLLVLSRMMFSSRCFGY